jgi:hypothetical protein
MVAVKFIHGLFLRPATFDLLSLFLSHANLYSTTTMASVISLPYYASDLPCPLPTETEIDEASDISLAYGGRRIVRVGPSFVVKYGEPVNLLEGENMLFCPKKYQYPGSSSLRSFLEPGNEEKLHRDGTHPRQNTTVCVASADSIREGVDYIYTEELFC